MPLEICCVGGFNECGRQMLAVKVDDEVVIFDMGLNMPQYIKVQEEIEDFAKVSAQMLYSNDAIPQDGILKKWKPLVKAIIPSHAHLDHIGAIPFMANKYKCPIIGTPFTIAVLRRILSDSNLKIQNKLTTVQPNTTYKISKNLTVDFINIPHSTPQASALALHTKYGIILYATDWKFDDTPVIGLKPNYKKLEEIAKKGVLLCTLDCLYADYEKKMPSESVAKQMLEDVLLTSRTKGSAIIVTTFASHLARIKTIIACAKKLKRKVVFIGRSLSKYTKAGEDVNLIQFSKDVDVLRFSRKAAKKLDKLQKEGLDKYVLVVTGHQGEERAVLSRMARQEIPFDFKSDDMIVFSCRTIPTDINKENRARLESDLKKYGVRIFKDVHVSGHPGREDLREMIKIIQPKFVLPIHGHAKKVKAFTSLAKELGYTPKKGLLLLKSGDFYTFR